MIRGLPTYDPQPESVSRPPDSPSAAGGAGRGTIARRFLVAGALAAALAALAVILGYGYRTRVKHEPASPVLAAPFSAAARPAAAGPAAKQAALPATAPVAASTIQPSPGPSAGSAAVGTEAGWLDPSRRPVFCVQGRGGKVERRMSAVLVDPSGLLLATDPVAFESSSFLVHLSESRFVPAELAGADPERGLALLQMNAVAGLQPVVLETGPGPGPGDSVVAVTCSQGGEIRPNEGTVSAEGGLVRLNRSLEPSDDGGLLLDSRGRIAGILRGGTGKNPADPGAGLAIPITTVRDFLAKWKEGRAGAKSEDQWIEQCEKAADPGARRDCYREALTIRPRMPRVSYHLAGALGDLGEEGARIEILEDVVRGLPRFMDARLDLIGARSEAGDWKQAGEACTESLTIDSKDPRLLTVCAEVDRRLDRCYSALYKTNQAVGLDPLYPQAYRNRAVIYSSCLGRCDAAIGDYRKYLELEPRAMDAAQVEKDIRHCQSKPLG